MSIISKNPPCQLTLLSRYVSQLLFSMLRGAKELMINDVSRRRLKGIAEALKSIVSNQRLHFLLKLLKGLSETAVAVAMVMKSEMNK